MAMQWNPKHSQRASDKLKRGSNDGSSSGKHNRQEKHSRNEKSRQKDRDALFWGPAEQGERNLYRRSARCYDCGAKYNPSHTCSENDKKGSTRQGSTDDNPKE